MRMKENELRSQAGERTRTWGIYGKYGRFARWLLRSLSHRYHAKMEIPKEPVVYVCRHLNMHGPYTTIKWLPMELHPMILHVFFDKEENQRHLTEYTFSKRFGKEIKKFSPLAWFMSRITPPLMHSLQAVPVYRDGLQTINTMKAGLAYLLKGENLIIYPDVQYTAGYETDVEIYDGFLYMGDLYYRKTGKTLSFVPLVIDDDKRTITPGAPVTLTNYRQERQEAAQALQKAINGR